MVRQLGILLLPFTPDFLLKTLECPGPMFNPAPAGKKLVGWAGWWSPTGTVRGYCEKGGGVGGGLFS